MKRQGRKNSWEMKRRGGESVEDEEKMLSYMLNGRYMTTSSTFIYYIDIDYIDYTLGCANISLDLNIYIFVFYTKFSKHFLNLEPNYDAYVFHMIYISFSKYQYTTSYISINSTAIDINELK